MRFLANENFPGDAVTALRASGHDVAWIRTDAPGSPDVDVLARATSEDRILLTFDKDFGELAWNSGLSAKAGVILFRVPMPPAATAGAALAGLVTQRNDWHGQFSVIEPGRVRMRFLPAK